MGHDCEIIILPCQSRVWTNPKTPLRPQSRPLTRSLAAPLQTGIRKRFRSRETRNVQTQPPNQNKQQLPKKLVMHGTKQDCGPTQAAK